MKHALQRGVALILALIFLVLMTIIGVTAMQSATQEEKIASNIYDLNRAFQASDATLQWTYEKVIGGNFLANVLEKEDQGFYLTRLNPPSQPLWCTVQWDNSDSLSYSDFSKPIDASDVQFADSPRYIVEEFLQLNPDLGIGRKTFSQKREQAITYYRVTTKGVGAVGTTQQLLQGVIKR